MTCTRTSTYTRTRTRTCTRTRTRTRTHRIVSVVYQYSIDGVDGYAAAESDRTIYHIYICAAAHADASRTYKRCCRRIIVCMTCIASYKYCSNNISTVRDIARRWCYDGADAAARVKNIQVVLPSHYSIDAIHTQTRTHAHKHTHTYMRTHTHKHPQPPLCHNYIPI